MISDWKLILPTLKINFAKKADNKKAKRTNNLG